MQWLGHAMSLLFGQTPTESLEMLTAFSFVPFLGAVAHAAVVHYPPAQSTINNFTFALNGSGSPGIFSSSVTPDKQYGEYNWCNMPHVRDREYK